ncbi:hypothetical protein LINPERHAP1_LOCUS22768 [Linum perenne]
MCYLLMIQYSLDLLLLQKQKLFSSFLTDIAMFLDNQSTKPNLLFYSQQILLLISSQE